MLCVLRRVHVQLEINVRMFGPYVVNPVHALREPLVEPFATFNKAIHAALS
jgi:hypothetical protein